MKLISAHYPLPEELEHAYSPEEASALVRDSLRQRRDIPGLQALRAEHTTVFDTDIVNQVKNGKWLLVKDEAYYFDWGQFDEPARQAQFEQRVQQLMKSPPKTDSTVRYGQIFKVVNSETNGNLAFRSFIAVIDGQEISGSTDLNGMASIYALSSNSRILIRVAFESSIGSFEGFAVETNKSGFVTEMAVRDIEIDKSPILIAVNDRAMTREFIMRSLRRSGFSVAERSTWGAAADVSSMSYDWDYSMIAIHHAGRTYGCGEFGAVQLQRILSDHKKKFDDIGYHFGIDCAGQIFEARDVRFKGSHVDLFNSRVIGIVLLADLTTLGEARDSGEFARGLIDVWSKIDNIAPAPQVEALKALVAALRCVFPIHTLGGHREYPNQSEAGKLCPGDKGMEIISELRRITGLEAPKS